jgi:hypothetical protein
VVRVTVAIPVASVVEVALEKVPFPSLLLHVTICPAVATALPLASANCAVIVTPLPAVGDEVDVVAKYLLAVPGVGVIDCATDVSELLEKVSV